MSNRLFNLYLRAAHRQSFRRSASRRVTVSRHRKLLMESLEDRRLLADISITGVRLVQADDRTTPTTPAIGEHVCVRADFQVTGLTAGTSYRFEYVVDGVATSSTTSLTSNGSHNLTNCGIYASPGQHTIQSVTADADNVVAETNEFNNTLAPNITFTPLPPTTLPEKFLLPLGGVTLQDWSLQNYVDVNPAVDPQGQSGSQYFQDFRGGPFTYDTHTGHDISLTTFAQMDQGIPVYAAADGSVEQEADGNFDRNAIQDITQQPNYVLINNGNGWETEYLHFRMNTITVKVGDTVTAGQLLGFAGSSGYSNGTHLHFQVMHHNAIVETEYDPADYYITPLPYQGDAPTTIKDMGITNFIPSIAEFGERPAEQNVFSTLTPTNVTFWVDLSNLAPGGQVAMKVYRPDGTLEGTYYHAASTLERGTYWYWTLPSASIANRPGTWRIAAEIKGVELASRTFQVTTGAGAAGIKVATADGAPVSNNRSTPINLGTVTQGDAPLVTSFTVTNHGTAPLTLSSPSAPPGVSLIDPYPLTIPAGVSSTLCVQLDASVVGAKFGAVQFMTNDPLAPLFDFNVSGTVGGIPSGGSPVITLGGPATAYLALGQPVLISPAAIIADSNSANFVGGILTAILASPGTTQDTLAIQNNSLAAGQIGVAGPTVTYGGVPIGTWSGGTSGLPLTISLFVTATQPAVQALARNITFSTTAIAPQSAVRYVRFSLLDNTANLSNLAIAVVDQNTRPTTVTIDASGNLVITDSSDSGKNDSWQLSMSGANLILTDLTGNTIDASSLSVARGNGGSSVTIPTSLLTGKSQLIIDSRRGADTLNIDLTSGNPIPGGGIDYIGGLQMSGLGDSVVVTSAGQNLAAFNCSNGGGGALTASEFGPINCLRLAPLAISGTSADLVINLPAGPTTIVLEDDGIVGNGLSRLRSSNGTFAPTIIANPTGSLTITRGNPADNVTILAAPDFTAGLTIGSPAAPLNTLTFAGPLTLAADKNLSGAAAGTITFSDPTADLALTGTGSISLTTARDLTLLSGASISVVNGNLILSANQQQAPATGILEGIVVRGASLTTSGTGNISLAGQGGNDVTSGYHNGVSIENGVIQSTSAAPGAGTITIVGQGGDGTTDDDGVVLQDVNGAPSSVTTGAGDIAITGTAGSGSTQFNRGVTLLYGSQVTSTGVGPSAGKIALVGTGGPGTDFNIGVDIAATSANGVRSGVSSQDGAISITGQASATTTASNNFGVGIRHGAQLKSTGTATIKVLGNAGGGTTDNDGVLVADSGTQVSTVNGNIQLTGTGGNGTTTFNRGVAIINGGQVFSTGTGASAGNVTILGQGGAGTDRNSGVDTGGGTSLISTVDGDISLTGTASSLTTGSGNYGVRVGVPVKSTGVGASAGTITISGTAGGGTTTNQGIRLEGTTSNIASIDGNVTLTGTATVPTGTFEDGVRLTTGAGIHTTGLATLLVTGAPGGTTGSVGVGLRLGGTNPSTVALFGAQNTFVADRMILDTTNLAIAAGSQTVTLRPQTTGTAIDLGSTTDTKSQTLELSDAELARITAGTLAIGDANSGSITVSNTLSQPGKNLLLTTAAGVSGNGDILNGSALAMTVTITQAGDSTYDGSLGGPIDGDPTDMNLSLVINGAGQLTLSAANAYTGPTTVTKGTLTLNGSTASSSAVAVQNDATLAGTGAAAGDVSIAAGGRLAPGSVTAILQVGSLTLASGAHFDVDLNGTTAGNDYDQVITTSGVSLDGASLNLAFGFVPKIGDVFILISNGSADPVTGEFAGYPEGKAFSLTIGSSIANFRITYQGGDGNDVVLAAVNAAPTLNPILPSTEFTTQLVGDINQALATVSVGGSVVKIGGISYFAGSVDGADAELWRSDGTPSGTFLVKDIYPGAKSSDLSNLFDVNGTLLFTANDSAHGYELWRSDGTGSGTVLVKDIHPGVDSPYSFSLHDFATINNNLFFAANDGTNGYELWKSDGTATGTVMVKDILSGAGSSAVRNLTNWNGTLFFSAGYGLWKSDGTSDGTVLVKNISTSSGVSRPDSFMIVDGMLFFRASANFGGPLIWKSDGTLTGTVPVQNDAGAYSYPLFLTEVNGSIFFTAFSVGTDLELWKTDGTNSGTLLVKDIRPGALGSCPQMLTNVNGTLFFVANDGTTDYELWKSDGTSEGTVLTKNVASGNAFTPNLTSNGFSFTIGTYQDSPLASMNGIVYFVPIGNSTQPLWRSDGTQDGTRPTTDVERADYQANVLSLHPIAAETTITQSSAIGPIVDVNGIAYFAADDGIHGEELWKTDGTTAGTVLVKDLAPGSASASPDALTNVNGTLFFRASDGINTRLWKSDGTPAGTVPVGDNVTGLADIFAANNGQSSLPADASSPGNLTNVDGELYFLIARGYGENLELWKTDGSEAGTALVKDLSHDTYNFEVRYLTNVNGKLFFSGSHISSTYNYFSSAATTSASDGKAHVTGGNSGCGFFEGYFGYGDPFGDYYGDFSPHLATYVDADALWTSDGTSAGTFVLKSFPRVAASNDYYGFGGPASLTALGGKLLFSARDDANGTELWTSDGTAAGTIIVKDIVAGASGSYPASLTQANGSVLFEAGDAAHGYELWKTDGTAPGTMLIKDINPGVASSIPSGLVNVNGIIYFTANDGTHGTELWKTDGTASGTSLVVDLAPGSPGSSTGDLTNANGRLFFVAAGADLMQIWTLDAAAGQPIATSIFTAASTRLDSTPDDLANLNGNLLFSANDGTHGTELWIAQSATADGQLSLSEDAPTQSIPLTGISAGPGESQTLTATATSDNPALIPNITIDYTSPNSTGTLSFQPLPNQIGTATITVTVNDDGGTANGGIDAFTRTFTVKVTPVNDPPSFDHHSDYYSADDENPATHGPAHQQIVSGWATNISVGPVNESDQKPSFEIANDNHALFTDDGQPTLDASGNLSYTPMPNAHGMAHVTVILHDSGDGANTSPPVTFEIQIDKKHRLHNAADSGARNGLDVTGSTSPQPDGLINAGDVLAVIDYINAQGAGHIRDDNQSGPPYVDVTGDDEVVPEDVIDIINWINAHPSQSEADGVSRATVSNSVTYDQSINAAADVYPQTTSADLISLLAADVATAAIKRRRSSF